MEKIGGIKFDGEAVVDSWAPTAHLRILVIGLARSERDRLQQKWVNTLSGSEEWRDVPEVSK